MPDMGKEEFEKMLSRAQGLYFKCEKSGHFARDCPMEKPMAPGRSKKQRAMTTTQVLSLTLVDATASNDVVIGTFTSCMNKHTHIRIA